MIYEVGVVCEICGIQGILAAHCQINFQEVKHANVVQNFKPRPQNNYYSNTI